MASYKIGPLPAPPRHAADRADIWREVAQWVRETCDHYAQGYVCAGCAARADLIDYRAAELATADGGIAEREDLCGPNDTHECVCGTKWVVS